MVFVLSRLSSHTSNPKGNANLVGDCAMFARDRLMHTVMDITISCMVLNQTCLL
jgi:hypothetical protein